MDVLTRWADNSVKHAIISGTAAMTSGTPAALAMTIGAAATGTTITTADLAAAVPAGLPFTAGAFGSATISASDFLSPAQVVATGPRMSSWLYRKQIGSDPHLVAWAEVRMWSTGDVEVFPWIENGYLGVASPINKSETYTFTMGGTLRFSQAIDIKHHTRIPLVNTSTGQGDARTFSHWLGTSPGVVPAHDGAYLRATKAIPNAYWAAPSGTVLDATQQTYTPNTLANDTNATGGAGGSGAIISPAAARYVNSGDVRAWKGMMVHALSAGSWSWHFRDSSTQQPPLYASYATVQIGDAAVPAGSGGTNHSGGPAMSHMASYAYLPFLVTGRWWFLEELQFQATWGFLSVSPAYRGNGTPAIDTGSGYTVRGGAWSMNLAAQAASITPSSHPLSAQFIATWERTTALLYGKYVSGSLAGGAWVSPLGVLGSYSGDVGQPTPWAPPTVGTAWWDAMYQHNYIAMVLGFSSDIGILQSGTSQTNHAAVRNHSYKLVVGRADDGFNGRYNWRRFISFAAPIGTDAAGLPLEAYYSTHAQMYAELRAGYSLASIPSNPGLSLKQHSSDSDLTNGDSSRTYGSTALAALAMAVEHGADGASEGYARVTSASNYASSFATYLADEAPDHAVTPRLPFDIPAVGTISDFVTTPTNLVSALGHNGNFMNAFGGIIWAPGLGALGSILYIGGGHGDGGYNSIGRLDIATGVFTRIKDAAPIFNKFVNDGRPNANALYCAHPDNGWMYSNNNTADFESVTVGELAAVHSHTAYVWMPQKANPAVTAADGFLFFQGLGGFYESGQRSNSAANRLTLGNQLWTRVGADLRPETYLSFYTFGSYSQAYDPSRNLVWGKLEFTAGAGGSASLTIASKDPVAAAFTGYTMTAGSGVSHLSEYNVLEYSARHDCLINMAGAFGGGGTFREYTRLHVYDLSPDTKVSYTPPQTGTVPTTLLDHTVRCWCDSLNAVALLNGTGADQNIHFLKPTGDPRTAAWAWSSQAITGTIRPVAGIGNGTPGENKLRHIPGLSVPGGKQVFLYFSKDQNPVQIIVTNAP